jgi:hypothetical protein
MDRYREWHRIDLVTLLINRGAIDPLAIIYLAHFNQFGKSTPSLIQGGKIWGMSDEQSDKILSVLSKIPKAIIKVYTQQNSIREDIGFALPLNEDVMKYRKFGIETGLFACTEPEPFEGMYPTVCYYATHQCSVSFEFIERTATRAFLCMRQLLGRDVAGLIARMVAQMYMKDYEWLRTTTITESSLRERILRWIPDGVKIINEM